MVVDEPCLYLNRSWQPIAFVPVKAAISILMRDLACAIHPETYEPLSFEEWMDRAPDGVRWIKTASEPFPAPDVVVLKQYGKLPPPPSGLSRQNLFRRDGFTCQYCDTRLPGEKLQIEHVVPRAQGGLTVWTNVVASCGACNRKKADRTPEEAKMRLIRPPYEPKFSLRVIPPWGYSRPLWNQFLRQKRA